MITLSEGVKGGAQADQDHRPAQPWRDGAQQI